MTTPEDLQPEESASVEEPDKKAETVDEPGPATLEPEKAPPQPEAKPKKKKAAKGGKAGKGAGTEAAHSTSFFVLNFNELDRNLSPEERQEWNSIYASYRSRSNLTGTIIGADEHSFNIHNKDTGADP